ncbi:hypothetical protein M9H77_33395 [Catharanthus roseus]|uniref:Uncharacterized protein n=1 Tax=Catharanthus roseus TaxID=4058 RepID=A0ACB9ZIL7_CATRO|nr:hypothetical protein M9H77_33395 [Catharanthus roseus]
MAATSFFFIFFIHFFLLVNSISCKQIRPELDPIRLARSGLLHAMKWADQGLKEMKRVDQEEGLDGHDYVGKMVLGDCLKVYGDCEPKVEKLVFGKDYSYDDEVAWINGVMANHRSCLDGLEEMGMVFYDHEKVIGNLTFLLDDALVSLKKQRNRKPMRKRFPRTNTDGGLLASWNTGTSKADIVVAQDGSGNYKTINDAVSALQKMNRPERTIIYVKSGVYHENVEIKKNLKNLMFVGDGMDKTIVTGNKNVPDGSTTYGSATFGISGDGFWARDMTFENTAGPEKHQAVALRVSSDLSVFYRCSFKGYQDTLFVHSFRQFYRECHIYGTIDFIFGDAAVVFQNCDIFVKKPMNHQSPMITAQGRDNSNQNTGISIINCRVLPSSEFKDVKGNFKSYLGRPWKKYSRTVFLKTDLDGLVDPRGWSEWSGDFALSTLYYGEYKNSGDGASTANRVKWPGFHVLHEDHEASPFSVANFIQGHYWIPSTGISFSAEI